MEKTVFHPTEDLLQTPAGRGRSDMTDMEKIWKWNGVETYFDITNPGCMRRLMDALEGLRNNLAQFRREQDTDDMLSCHCGILQEFFDDVFGEGSGEHLCGKQLSAEAYSRAYLDFLDFVNGQMDALEAMHREAEGKYRTRAMRMGLETESAG